MLLLRCKICLDTMGSGSTPMATQCGHIYCLDCATFHFSQADPFCAVCRKPQTLENMIRLFTDSEEDSTDGNGAVGHVDEQISSSPVSVMSIERAGQDAALHDNQAQITRLKNEVQIARAAETAARLQLDGHRRALRRAEKQIAAKEAELQAQQERYEEIYQQCVVATEDATRQRVRSAKLLNDLEEMSEEIQKWKEHAAKAKRKQYYALKNEVKDMKQAARAGSSYDHRRSGSDDLEVI
ncbi:hypothetical protein BN946_scf184679.g5 [Trametes cinnabarina]|uniref:RING-type domain-containing protein n=1 Tax=Pycnoporus cinnabarinus TaxID=5643 RepID=A0A060SUV4_PYCCI|nr:hypothetical protein BN946_scf184679.g5 [Trametes cinnabarina]